jgi:hypothetical protein
MKGIFGLAAAKALPKARLPMLRRTDEALAEGLLHLPLSLNPHRKQTPDL